MPVVRTPAAGSSVVERSRRSLACRSPPPTTRGMASQSQRRARPLHGLAGIGTKGLVALQILRCRMEGQASGEKTKPPRRVLELCNSPRPRPTASRGPLRLLTH